MSDNLVTIATFENAFHAEMARNRLADEDIVAYVADEQSVEMLGVLANAFGCVKLQVAEKDAARAQEVLSREETESEPAEAGSAPESPATEEDEERVPTPGEVLANRAWRASIIGFFICIPVLHLYSLWVLLQLGGWSGDLASKDARKAYGALVIDVLVIVGWGLIARGMLFYWG